MDNKQQTAVDLYRIKISILTTDLFNEKISGNQFCTFEREAYEQAKKLEKEIIIDAHYEGQCDETEGYPLEISEQYYNETYGGGEQ